VCPAQTQEESAAIPLPSRWLIPGDCGAF
jgi:hypothetical protein